MPTELVEIFCGKPNEKRETRITEHGTSEEWYYTPLFKETGEPILDGSGRTKYKECLIIMNGKIKEIYMP